MVEGASGWEIKGLGVTEWGKEVEFLVGECKEIDLVRDFKIEWGIREREQS